MPIDHVAFGFEQRLLHGEVGAVEAPVTGHDPSLVTPTNSDDRYKQATHLKLYHSTDHGKTWVMQDVTPTNSGIIRYSWMGIADDGKTIGVGYFTHPTLTGNWQNYEFTNPVPTTEVGATLSFSLDPSTAGGVWLDGVQLLAGQPTAPLVGLGP